VATVAIIGDGPAGLSAGLFLAKNGHAAVIYGQDETPMHYAQLHNYLGIRDIAGDTFQEAARGQVLDQGAELRDEDVESITADGNSFTVTTDAGTLTADFVLLAGGKRAQRLARELGVEVVDGKVPVDTEYRTAVDRVYAAGRVARPERSQAIISAGAGATAALDILSREAGKDVHDWDTPDDPT
jgi:thioredoxin reductase (NADPH)